MDPAIRKRVLRQISNGIFVMTATSEGEVAAGTITWLSQASFKPPLVMVGVRHDSSLFRTVERSGAFAINIIGEDQQDLAATFFKPATVGDSTVNGYTYEPGLETGAPLLLDLPSWFEARVVDRVDKGDHSVLVAEVVAAGIRNPDARALALRETPWEYGG